MTIVPSIGTVSMTSRIASTATRSDLWRSPWPIVCAHAIAACSTTRRNSRERSESMRSDLRLRRFRVCGQLAARRTVGTVAEKVIGLHDLVNFARALVDHRALAVAEESAHRVLVRISVRAVYLHRVAGGAFGRDGREPLREAGLARVAQALILHPAGTQPQQTRRLIVGFHLRDHLLDELVLPDFDTEGLALLRVLHAR